jgi:hypothetical protein
MTEEWRRLRNEEPYYLYSVPDIIWVIKSGRRWTENVARVGDRRGYAVFWVAKIRGRILLGRLGIDGTIKIEIDLQEWFGGMDLIDLCHDGEK